MRIEGAARETDVGRPVVAKAAHVCVLAAKHPNRQAAGHGLAVSHHIRAHAEVFLRAAGREAKTHEHFIKDQHDAACAAHRAQALEPIGIACSVEAGLPGAVDQGRIPGRAAVGMQSLQRIDEHAGDVAPVLEHPKRGFVHVLQRVGIPRGDRVADAGLHIAPPAVICAAEAHQVGASGVVARQPHRLHDRLRAGHVKGNLIETRNLEQAPNVVGDERVIGAEHRPQFAHARAAALDAVLVEVVAEHIDAVGTRDVVEPIAVKIGDLDPGRGLQEGARFEVPPHVAAELKRHAIPGSEFEVGNTAGKGGGLRNRLLEACGIKRRQPQERGAPGRRHLRRRGIDIEEPRLVVLVKRNPAGKAPRHARMARERAMLRPGKLQSRERLAQQERRGESRQCVADRCDARFLGADAWRGLYCRRMTVR